MDCGARTYRSCGAISTRRKQRAAAGYPAPCPRPGRGPGAHHQDTGLGHLPSKSWQVNSGWCQAVAIAADLLAWFKLLSLTGELARAEPKTLRYRLLAVPARLTRGQRRRWLRLPRHWPWSTALATAIDKIRQLPPPTLQPG